MYPRQKLSRLNRIRQTSAELFVEYCSNSTIHGVGYIGGSDRKRSCWARLWWLLVLLLSLIACGSLIDTLYSKWQLKPVIISFDEQPLLVTDIPFPAMTICPEAQYRPQWVLNLTERLLHGGISNDESEVMYIALMSAECNDAYDWEDALNFTFRRNIVDLWKTIYLGNPRSVISSCFIMGKCKFSEVLTDKGICYSTNLLRSDEIFRSDKAFDKMQSSSLKLNFWSIDEGYHGLPDSFETDRNPAPYPNRSIGSGYKAGMQLELQMPLDCIADLCGQTKGFYIFLHSPTQYPLMIKDYVYLEYGEQVGIIVRPEIIKSSSEVLNYSTSQRKCFFSYERHLRYFINYTQANCEMECYINYTREGCRCVRFYMPRDDDIAVCEMINVGWWSCTYDRYMAASGHRANCGCLPGCNSIEYSAEIVPINFKSMRTHLPNYEKYKYSIANIYFSKFQYMVLKRSEVFGWTDFIAGCGGLLGLCLGVSLISLVELLYYCLVRPMLMIVKCRRLRSNVDQVVNRDVWVRENTNSNSTRPEIRRIDAPTVAWSRVHIPQKPSRLDRIRQTSTQLFAEYCSNSTIHGVGYIGGSDRKRSCWVRLWWLLMLLLSLTACGSLIDTLYSKWQLEPIITAFDKRPMLVTEIPFPAVTVCPEVQYRPQRVLNITKRLSQGEISNDEAEIMYIALVSAECDDVTDDMKEALNFTFRHDVMEVWKTIYLGNPDSVVSSCFMKGRCEFTEVLTDMGVCYSYNLLRSDEIFYSQKAYKRMQSSSLSLTSWGIDEGYYGLADPFDPDPGPEPYPYSSKGSGYKAGMQLELRMPLDSILDLCGPTKGFYIILHSPTEYPLIIKDYVYLEYGEQVGIIIRPEIVSASSEVLNYSPSQRQCFFSYERHLRYFINYTQANCEMECYINYTRDTCECMRYFMPQDDETAVCEMVKADKWCWHYQMYWQNGRSKCNCLPGCNSIEYSAEIVPINHKSKDTVVADYEKYKYSLANIYFSKFQYMVLKRREVFSWTDFIASCGGLLGLCLGVSLLSVVELLYYCLIRPVLMVVKCCRLRRNVDRDVNRNDRSPTRSKTRWVRTGYRLNALGVGSARIRSGFRRCVRRYPTFSISTTNEAKVEGFCRTTENHDDRFGL